MLTDRECCTSFSKGKGQQQDRFSGSRVPNEETSDDKNFNRIRTNETKLLLLTFLSLFLLLSLLVLI